MAIYYHQRQLPRPCTKTGQFFAGRVGTTAQYVAVRECLDEIPYVGRLMAVADVYDATRFARVYKGAWPHSVSTQYIMDNRGVLFDPVIAECFYENREIFKNISTSFQKIGAAFFS